MTLIIILEIAFAVTFLALIFLTAWEMDIFEEDEK
jgi:uncharacterized membrane protein